MTQEQIEHLILLLTELSNVQVFWKDNSKLVEIYSVGEFEGEPIARLNGGGYIALWATSYEEFVVFPPIAKFPPT